MAQPQSTTAHCAKSLKFATALIVAGLGLGACAITDQAHLDAGASSGGLTPGPSNTPTHTREAHDGVNNEVDGDYVIFNDAKAKRILASGMKGISKRYINPVSIFELCINALRGLSAIDPAITVDSVADEKSGAMLIALKHDAFDFSAFDQQEPHTLIALKPPAKIDYNGWAELIATAVSAAQEHGSEIRSSERERIYEALFDGMLVGLDIFSRYAGADEADNNRAQRDGFGGIGIQFIDGENLARGFPITQISPESPAASAGLAVGDKIVSVAGHRVKGKSIRQISALLRGPIGSQVRVGILRHKTGIGPIKYNIARAHIVPQTVTAIVESSLLVIRITSFNKHTALAVRDQFRNLADDIALGIITGVVLDLRNNPGGLLMQSVKVADLFLGKGQIVSTRGRHPDSLHNYQATGIDIAQGLPMVVLIDQDSASAAEIVASALQDQGRAVLVGSTSYGKGTVQTVLMLPNSGEITLTWSRLITPSGYIFHGLGVMPVLCANEGAAPPGLLTPSALKTREALIREWREVGIEFNARRKLLRQHCPGRAFEDSDPALMRLARNVLESPGLYRQSVLLTAPVDTASRK